MRARVPFHSLLVLACALAGRPLTAGDKPARPQTPDVVISTELEGKSKVLILKDRKTADSLFRLKEPPTREEFDRFVTDTAVTVEARTRAEFRRHWKELERREGFREMRAQYAAADPDRSRIPRVYLFDSSVVVYPGWIIVRRKPAR
jgi:hypothetical protein